LYDNNDIMTPRPKAKYPKNTVITLRISEAMAAELRAIQERDGVPVSEQVRRGIRLWVEDHKGVVKADRKRAGTRKRP
jgi:hypothetical protein